MPSVFETYNVYDYAVDFLILVMTMMVMRRGNYNFEEWKNAVEDEKSSA